MEDSPTRYSDSTKNQTKNLGIQESYSNKHDNVCKDEGSDKIERDSNIDELSKRTNIKRKRSRSPLQEPSSSKYYIESSEESRTSNEKRNLESERNISRRSHIVQDEEYEHPSFSLDRYRRSHHGRSRSPPITKNLNERFSRSLPPGAKERREQQEKERQEQLKKDYANLSYGGLVVTGDGSSTGNQTVIKDDADKSKTELIEADSTSNAENDEVDKDSADADNEIPLEDILQGKNPILYCTLGAKFRDLQLEFDQVKEEGPQHDRIFTWQMKIGNLETVGTGNSKKSAKNDAAEKMVRLLYKAPRPMRKPMWSPYGPPCGMFPPGMNVPGPPGMFPPFPRGFRPPPGMARPPLGMFGPRFGMVPFRQGFPGPMPLFNGSIPFPMPTPETCAATPEGLEFGTMTTHEDGEENDLGPPGEVKPASTMDSLFEVKAGSSTMDSLYQPEEGNATNSYVQATAVAPSNPPQFDKYAGANNPISKLYDMAKKEKIPEPLFETINEKVLSERKSHKGFTMKKTEYTIQCDFKGKKYEGKALTKKDAKLAAATFCWAEVGGGLPPGPASLQASISTLLQNQRQAASEAKPQVKTPAESRPGDWQCSNEECGNINFAWRKECNNCDTKKPHSQETINDGNTINFDEGKSEFRDRERKPNSKSHDNSSERDRSCSSSRNKEWRYDERRNKGEHSKSSRHHGSEKYSKDNSIYGRDSYRYEPSRGGSCDSGSQRKRNRSETSNHERHSRYPYTERYERLDRDQYDHARSDYHRHDRDKIQPYSYENERTHDKHSRDERYGTQRSNRESYDYRHDQHRSRHEEKYHTQYDIHSGKRQSDRDHRDRYR